MKRLFVAQSGEPLVFHMVPCPERRKVRRIIETHGGKMTCMAKAANYRLVSNQQHGDQGCLTIAYIYECVKLGKLLRIEPFRVKADAKPKRTRRPYTEEEDLAIISHILNNNHRSHTTLAVFEELEASGRLGSRTASSMHERFRKQLYPRLLNGELRCDVNYSVPTAAENEDDPIEEDPDVEDESSTTENAVPNTSPTSGMDPGTATSVAHVAEGTTGKPPRSPQEAGTASSSKLPITSRGAHTAPARSNEPSTAETNASKPTNTTTAPKTVEMSASLPPTSSSVDAPAEEVETTRALPPSIFRHRRRKKTSSTTEQKEQPVIDAAPSSAVVSAPDQSNSIAPPRDGDDPGSTAKEHAMAVVAAADDGNVSSSNSGQPADSTRGEARDGNHAAKRNVAQDKPTSMTGGDSLDLEIAMATCAEGQLAVGTNVAHKTAAVASKLGRRRAQNLLQATDVWSTEAGLQPSDHDNSVVVADAGESDDSEMPGSSAYFVETQAGTQGEEGARSRTPGSINDSMEGSPLLQRSEQTRAATTGSATKRPKLSQREMQSQSLESEVSIIDDDDDNDSDDDDDDDDDDDVRLVGENHRKRRKNAKKTRRASQPTPPRREKKAKLKKRQSSSSSKSSSALTRGEVLRNSPSNRSREAKERRRSGPSAALDSPLATIEKAVKRLRRKTGVAKAKALQAYDFFSGNEIAAIRYLVSGDTERMWDSKHDKALLSKDGAEIRKLWARYGVELFKKRMMFLDTFGRAMKKALAREEKKMRK